jgi:predicted TIM-barrel fold metal-dependent hydrolase
VLNEFEQLYILAENRMLPVLWIIPQMFDDGGLEMFLNSGLKWKCLKIHPQLNPEAWKPRGINICKLLRIAEKMNLPILIHTGEFDYCHAGLYQQLARKNPNVTFILAHGRPIEETVNVMKECGNVYADTAFMPTENILMLCKSGLTNRVLWGTDYPIPKYYYHRKNMYNYYNSLLTTLKKNVAAAEYDKIVAGNYNNLFANS